MCNLGLIKKEKKKIAVLISFLGKDVAPRTSPGVQQVRLLDSNTGAPVQSLVGKLRKIPHSMKHNQNRLKKQTNKQKKQKRGTQVQRSVNPELLDLLGLAVKQPPFMRRLQRFQV